MYDVVRACADVVDDSSRNDLNLFDNRLKPHEKTILTTIKQASLPKHIGSWRKVQGRLGQLLRLKIFDSKDAASPDYDGMTKQGTATIIDLSDTDSPQINNLVIAEILRGLRLQQEDNYKASEREGKPMRKLVTIIEEAHEFLSANRIRQMPVLFKQVARIARRGRKRWFGLIFVTQLPQHLPDEIFGLLNNYILHKIADGKVINRLKNSVGGVDPSLWDRLPNLSPGQAIVKAESMARPMLVVIDPTPCKLRLID
jgi:hypothetical protein